MQNVKKNYRALAEVWTLKSFESFNILTRQHRQLRTRGSCHVGKHCFEPPRPTALCITRKLAYQKKVD